MELEISINILQIWERGISSIGLKHFNFLIWDLFLNLAHFLHIEKLS